ncbi:MAG: sugar transferase, partial [Lentisphaerae bacterium]|nr:sugar transferase [Lentisphaerota bacterium]
MDIAASAAGLVVTAPLQLAVAVIVRQVHGSPVLFRQQRPGKDGEIFELLKFRSMKNPETGQETDEERLTQLGRFLRSTSLDELPSLWNVLKGDMSLVGPRPEVPRYMALYPEDARQRILSLRPGITDRAAIEFRDEERLLAASADP